MTFLNDVELWPQDISGKYIFILKATQEMGRSLGRNDTRLPFAIYRYDFVLPDFAHASEDDKAAAADVINSNIAGNEVFFEDEYLYSEQYEKSFLIRNAQITEQQWNVAREITQRSRETPIDNVDSTLAITSAIFSGVASEKVVAVQRILDRPHFTPMPAETLNIDNDAIIKARLALGRIDPDKPFDLDPRGKSYFFLESKSFQIWKNKVGKQKMRIEIAKRKLIRLAQNHDNRSLSDFVKESLLGKDKTSFNFEDNEKEMLWASLPDKPFKLPGLRQGASRKGRL